MWHDAANVYPSLVNIKHLFNSCCGLGEQLPSFSLHSPLPVPVGLWLCAGSPGFWWAFSPAEPGCTAAMPGSGKSSAKAGRV